MRQQAKPLEFYVSLNGDDRWSGRLSDPSVNGSDGPFASLEKARNRLKHKGAPSRPFAFTPDVQAALRRRATPIRATTPLPNSHAAAGTGMVLIVRTPGLITAAGALIGLGVGVFLSANWALVTDLVPAGEAARYLGIANIATAGGSGLARLMGGMLIDPLNRLLGSPSAGYLALYALTMVAFLMGTLAITRVPEARPEVTAGGLPT